MTDKEHLKAFAKDLLARENGVLNIATLTAVFTNIGNFVEGHNPMEQRVTISRVLEEAPKDGQSEFVLTDAGDISMRQDAAPEDEQPQNEGE